MEEVKNITFEEVLELIKDFPVKPRHTKVIITLNTNEEDNDLIVSDKAMSEVQYIMAKGDMIRDLDLGDKVLLDLDKMTEYKPNPNNTHEDIATIKIEPVIVGDRIFAFLDDKYIRAIDNREE